MFTEVLVSFRFIGPNTDPEVITSYLGIQPSEVYQKSQFVNAQSSQEYSSRVWVLDSSLPQEKQLEEHLDYLLQKLEPKAAALKQLSATGNTGEIFCSFFAESGGFDLGRIKLDNAVMLRIGGLGLELVLDIYNAAILDGD